MQAKLKPFDIVWDEAGENSYISTEHIGSSQRWNIYHPNVFKCLTIRERYKGYFGEIVDIELNTKLHKIQPLNRTIYDVYYCEDRGYHHADRRLLFQAYEAWFEWIGKQEHLPGELFEL
jgi:hypothetical protein